MEMKRENLGKKERVKARQKDGGKKEEKSKRGKKRVKEK